MNLIIYNLCNECLPIGGCLYNGIIEMDVVVAAKASLRDSDRRISALADSSPY